MRIVLVLILWWMLAPAMAQEVDPDADVAAPDTVETGDEDDAEALPDDLEVPEGNYADAEEEDFVPSEDIPTDQAIPFPTDI